MLTISVPATERCQPQVQVLTSNNQKNPLHTHPDTYLPVLGIRAIDYYKKSQRKWINFRIYFLETGRKKTFFVLFWFFVLLRQSFSFKKSFSKPGAVLELGTNSVDQAGLSQRSAFLCFQNQGLKVCATSSWLKGDFLYINLSKSSLSQNMMLSVGWRAGSPAFCILPDGLSLVPSTAATSSPPITPALRNQTGS